MFALIEAPIARLAVAEQRPHRPRSNAFFKAGPAASVPPSQHHVGALDGLRGIAILLVLMFHWTLISIAPTVLDRLVQKTAAIGWFGVDLFFVLSGFLITGILLDCRGKSHYFRTFYIRRALRILPLSYAFLFGFLCVLPAMAPAIAAKFGPPSPHRWAYWLYLSNFLNVIYPPGLCKPMGAMWSLGIEEQFYLFWPIVVLLAGPRRLGQICIGILAASLALRLGLVLAHYDFTLINHATPCHMDTLAMGGLLALRHRQNGLQRYIRPAIAIIILVPILCVVLDRIGGRLPTNRPFLVVGFTLLAALFGSTLVLAIHQPHLRWLLNGRWLRWLGRRSYALYLFNLPVMIVLQTYLFDPRSFEHRGSTNLPAVAMFLLLAMTITAVMAEASWHVIERPFLLMKPRRPNPGVTPEAGLAPDARGATDPDIANAAASPNWRHTPRFTDPNVEEAPAPAFAAK